MELHQKRILLVDDFKDGRDLYEFILSQKGFRVTVAKDGQEALDKAMQLRPDLVVMDLSLPVISGWDVTRRLKADERTRQIPVVILTAHELHNATAALGCEGFLLKPCLPEAMVAEVVRVLGNHAQSESTGSSASARAAGAKQGGTQAGPGMR